MSQFTTVHQQTYDLLRRLGLTTIFGNPGSTEEPFLKDFPEDFTFVLGLQEASVVAMADGYAQATGKPVLVNVHTVAGMGNALGNINTAWLNKTPLIITAGQQTREMLLIEPWLTNVDATTFPRPHIKWSYEPTRAQDVPGALLRAYATVLQPPQGPAFLSLPLDDWDKPASNQPGMDISKARSFSHRFAPDPVRLQTFAQIINQSKNPALIIGGGVDRSGGWDDAIRLAETLQADVYAPPVSERVGFPENHPFYRGALPFAIKPLAAKLEGHDVVVVVGAPVFRYYPYVAGDYLPAGTRLLHVTDDPAEAARAAVGESLLGDPGLFLELLLPLVSSPAGVKGEAPPARPDSKAPAVSHPDDRLMSVDALFAALAQSKPHDAILVEESPSNISALHARWQVTQSKGFYTMASGGLGFGLPAAVGVALAERDAGRHRRVVAIIGDGSFQYSIQGLWTAARHHLPILFVVPMNAEYAILKAYAKQQNTPGVPGLDLPGLDIAKLAEGYGCTARRVETAAELSQALTSAWQSEGPVVLAVAVNPEVPPLL